MKKVSKIVIYGDSLSTGTHGDGAYLNFLKVTYGAELANYAVGASGLSLNTPNNAVSILLDGDNIPEDADLVFMWHGSNDWYWGTPLGELEDEDPSTFYGAIHTAVKCIREKLPTAAFAWATPVYRLERPDGGKCDGNAYASPNKVGKTLGDYYDAIMKASVRYGFYVIDTRRGCGIHELNRDLYLEDKAHPNKAGYEKISRVLKRGLDELLYYEGYEI